MNERKLLDILLDQSTLNRELAEKIDKLENKIIILVKWKKNHILPGNVDHI